MGWMRDDGLDGCDAVCRGLERIVTNRYPYSLVGSNFVLRIVKTIKWYSYNISIRACTPASWWEGEMNRPSMSVNSDSTNRDEND